MSHSRSRRLAAALVLVAGVASLDALAQSGGGSYVRIDRPERVRSDGTVVPGEPYRGALEAGAGLRFHFEYGGIQPGVLAFDFGFPLSRYWDVPQSTLTAFSFYMRRDPTSR